jgi:metal-responsive CopG/Arc/MetJ family transcriptional regulator
MIIAMSIIKRTFSIPDEVSAELDQTIPNQERSKFVTQTLSEALKQKNREKLVQAIDEIETWESSEEPVVEIIRKIRDTQSARLVSKQ